MENALTIALSRVVSQQRGVEVRAHNIANAATPGYRAERMLFSDYLVRQARTADPAGGRVLQYVQDRATWRDNAPGALSQTGNPLDLAIAGEGFFVVATPEGERYTRAGRFTLDGDGRIIDASGNALQGIAGALLIPPDTGPVTISAEGAVANDQGEIGRLRIVRFEDENRLRREGDRLFRAEIPPQDVPQPKVVQGAVEESNVRSVVELTLLMEEMREFQMATTFIEKEAERLASIPDRILRSRRS